MASPSESVTSQSVHCKLGIHMGARLVISTIFLKDDISAATVNSDKWCKVQNMQLTSISDKASKLARPELLMSQAK